MTDGNPLQRGAHHVLDAPPAPEAWRSPPTLIERMLVLNCYGTFCLLAGKLLTLAGVVLVAGAGELPVAAAFLVLGIALGLFGWRITRRLPYRARLFRNTIRRIERSGFNEDYFKNLCGDFCTRRVAWLVLRRVGKLHRYTEMVRVFRRNSTIYMLHSSPELQALIDDGYLNESELKSIVSRALG